MDFLSNSVYGVPVVLLLALWWMTTQLKVKNLSKQNLGSFDKTRVKCRSCAVEINSKATKCLYCGAVQ